MEAQHAKVRARPRSSEQLAARANTRRVAPEQLSPPVDAYAAYLAWLQIDAEMSQAWSHPDAAIPKRDRARRRSTHRGEADRPDTKIPDA